MRSIASVLLLLSSFTPAIAAQSQAAPVAQASVSTVSAPHLVTFSGSVHEPSAVKAGVAGVTFAIYKNQQGGAALWMETQNVKLDPSGRYTVSLGATKPTGLPVELFVSGEAQWLGITVAGQPEQDRVLLLSVPYALKAADAETIGGLAPSAFVLAAPLNGTALSTAATTSPTAPVGTVTGSGTQNFVPLWTNSTGLLGNSVLFQSGTGSTAAIGINTTTPVGTLDVKGSATVRGTLNLPATGSATATAGKNRSHKSSPPLLSTVAPKPQSIRSSACRPSPPPTTRQHPPARSTCCSVQEPPPPPRPDSRLPATVRSSSPAAKPFPAPGRAL
jgi:hypothetical protein